MVGEFIGIRHYKTSPKFSSPNVKADPRMTRRRGLIATMMIELASRDCSTTGHALVSSVVLCRCRSFRLSNVVILSTADTGWIKPRNKTWIRNRLDQHADFAGDSQVRIPDTGTIWLVLLADLDSRYKMGAEWERRFNCCRSLHTAAIRKI